MLCFDTGLHSALATRDVAQQLQDSCTRVPCPSWSGACVRVNADYATSRSVFTCDLPVSCDLCVITWNAMADDPSPALSPCCGTRCQKTCAWRTRADSSNRFVSRYSYKKRDTRDLATFLRFFISPEYSPEDV